MGRALWSQAENVPALHTVLLRQPAGVKHHISARAAEVRRALPGKRLVCAVPAEAADRPAGKPVTCEHVTNIAHCEADATTQRLLEAVNAQLLAATFEAGVRLGPGQTLPGRSGLSAPQLPGAVRAGAALRPGSSAVLVPSGPART